MKIQRKSKKGFTLVESVISMAIILLISICFYSLINYANISFQKNVAVNIAVKQINNALIVFESEDFVLENAFSLTDFEEKIGWAFEHNVIVKDVGKYECSFNEQGQFKGNGKIKITFIVSQNNGAVSFTASAFSSNSKVYQMKDSVTKQLIIT